MANASYGGPHSNPVWSTFIFVLCMLLFLFYLETMIKPLDFLVTKSFVIQSSSGPLHEAHKPTTFAKYGDRSTAEGVIHGLENVLVFLHIQKTAGKAYNAHIALDLHPDSGPGCSCPEMSSSERDLLSPGSCVCDLENDGQSTWLFSRLTVGWPCGVHAGWTDLTTGCMDKELNHRENRTINRKYFMFTMLRDPVTRYLNEWRQVTYHGQWPIKKLFCHPLADKLYFEGNWTGVTLDNFIHCSDNPANNRQTWMMSDLKGVGCSRVKSSLLSSISDPIDNNTLLQSAKRNLADLPFFGLLEYPTESDILFEHIFGVKFSSKFATNHFESSIKLTAEQSEKMTHNNRLDTELYIFAKELFFQRYNNLTKPIHQSLHASNIG